MDNQKKINNLWIVFVLEIVIYFVTAVVLNILNSYDITLPTMVTLVLSEVILLIPVVIYMRINGLKSAKELGYHSIKIGTIFMTALLGLLVMPIASFVNILTQFFVSNTMVQASDQLTDAPIIVVIFITGVLAPVIEEFIFRGVMNTGFKKYITPLGAAVVSSIMFGLMHLNINQTCYAIVLGLIFAIVNEASGSVLTSTIIHIVINTVNMAMLVVTNAALDQVDVDLVESTESVRQNTAMLGMMAVVYFVMALICGCLGYLCVKWIAKHEGRTEDLIKMFARKTTNEDITNDADEAEKNDSELEPAENSATKLHVYRNIPAIISIILCIVIMFVLDPLMKMITK